jgi:hypothetical protein
MQSSLFGPEHITDAARSEMITHHQKQILGIYNVIRDLQNTCPHNDSKRVHKSDTGNWCRADDSYWTDCKCNVCGKTWVENYSDGYTR